MAISLQKGQEKVKEIRVEGAKEKEKEVIVRHATALLKKGRSPWSWHEEFVLEWSETFITKKRKRDPRQGE